LRLIHPYGSGVLSLGRPHVSAKRIAIKKIIKNY